jgi:voltage-gated potassium channel
MAGSGHPRAGADFKCRGVVRVLERKARQSFYNPRMHDEQSSSLSLRQRLHVIIFEADTPAGRGFDNALLVCVVASVVVVMLESVADVNAQYGQPLHALEWIFTAIFTVEYVLRLYCVDKPARYATSFFGMVDLLAVLPSYLSPLLPGAQSLLVIRLLRMLRVFRVFKLAEYLSESSELWDALRRSRRKISVFLFTVTMIVVIVGAAMYLVEGPEHGFTSIPASVYWAVVTLTTVGYGDISPQTPLGRFLAVFVMLIGYGIIAVPTGIVTAEMSRRIHPPVSTQACPACGAEGHDHDAVFCRKCGARL